MCPSILSKVFEYCFINKFGKYLYTDEKQFGFKKGVGCTHAIYTVHKIVESITKGGNTLVLFPLLCMARGPYALCCSHLLYGMQQQVDTRQHTTHNTQVSH